MQAANDYTAWRTSPNLHEVIAKPGHGISAVGFGLSLAMQALASVPNRAELLWVRETAAVLETGEVYGPGLASFGMSPESLVVVELRTQRDALRAALEGARCAALGAVLLETAGPIELTASRRLKLAAEKSGVAIILIRPNAQFAPNAFPIRWRVEAAPQLAVSTARPRTASNVELLKHPMGLSGKSCVVEWDHERQRFAQALPLPVATVSVVRSLAA